MADRPEVFVAYPAADAALSNGIMEAVRKANAVVLPVKYTPWPFNDIAGAELVSPILEKIDQAPFIIADITYLNLNVVYEIGFTIGKGRRPFLVRHNGIAGDKTKATSVGIFDTLGYFAYDDLAHSKTASKRTSRPLISHSFFRSIASRRFTLSSRRSAEPT